MISGQRQGVRWEIRLFKSKKDTIMHTHRIGILTGGGDCPGLNAVLRGVTKASEKLGWQVIGFLDGFEGLLPPSRYIVLDHTKTTGIMQQGGTILGDIQQGPFRCQSGRG
jgi:6-phosphofructokinase